METEGFLLTRQWHQSDSGQQDLEFWLATASKPLRVVQQAQPSVCFIDAKDESAMMRQLPPGGRLSKVMLKSFAGAPVLACYWPTQRDMQRARQRISPAVRLFEADVRPTDRYLMERFITGGVKVTGEVVEHEDFIEMTDPQMRPSDFEPDLRVASIDIETSWTEHIIYSIATQCGEEQRVFMVGEAPPDPPDYLVMCATEADMIRDFLSWFAVLDPDVIIGWSVVGFDLRFIQQRCEALELAFTLGRGRREVTWRSVGERRFVQVPGRVVLDGIEMLRTATWSFESFSLEFVARELLGRGKLVEDVDARAVEIQQMYQRDKRALAEYNLEDCVLVSDIFAHADLIQFAIARSRMTGLELDRPGGSVAAFDFLYLPFLHREGYVAPVVVSEEGVGSPGGYVLDSRPGLYDHVVVLDFKSLYPSIIRTFHVDPLAMVIGSQEQDAVPGFKGANFSRHQVILPALIETLWQRRDEAKQAGNAPLSQAIKIIMNSFYGVLGTPGCRFFDPRLVSSITLRGHEILQRTRDLIEARGFAVIYGDTDSVFVLMDQCSGSVEASAETLVAELNAWWRHHLATSIQVESFLEVEFETHFEKFLMPSVRGSDKGSKKRYAGMLGEDQHHQLVFKGLETVRSDWSPLAREFQQQLYRKIFTDEPYKAFVRETVREVLDGERDDDLLLRRRLRRNLDDYTRNVPPHVRAARHAEAIRRERGLEPLHGRGSWVEYLMTVGGPQPKAYRDAPIDYDFYVERQLAPIADAILSLKSTSLAELIDRQLDLF